MGTHIVESPRILLRTINSIGFLLSSCPRQALLTTLAVNYIHVRMYALIKYIVPVSPVELPQVDKLN